MSTYIDYDIFLNRQQMFPTPVKQAPDIVFLVFYIIALGLALHRFRWAPGLLPTVLHAAIQIAALSSRLYWHNGDNVSVDLVFAVQALLAIAFLLLAYQLILLKSEHFHISRSHPSWFLLRRYQLITQLLAIPLIAALIVIIVYAALLKNGKNVSDLWRTFNILLFVWWAAFVLWMIFTPFWARENKAITGMFILLLTLILLVPILYIELRWQHDLSWVSNTITAYSVLWLLPQALVTIGILMLPISYWYADDHRSMFIY